VNLISVEKAVELIAQNIQDWGTESLETPMSAGRILAEDIFADRDQPPFNRVTMDGFALNSNHILPNIEIQDIQLAGEAQKTLELGKAIEIMTGAALPIGANCVVPYEKCSIKTQENRDYLLLETAVFAQMNVHLQGSDAKEKELLLEKGLTIDSAKIAIMTSMGYAQVLVKKLPKVVFISTGNELVETAEKPLQHQIRSSNNHMVFSHFHQMGIQCTTLKISDDFEQLTSGIEKALNHFDIIILSGGVSKGKVDHVPTVLQKLGVSQIFHKIAQRPGKPLWFGTKENKLVFGLPGNPVSSLVCFLKYIKPILPIHNQNHLTVALGHDIEFTPELTFFQPVILKNIDGKTLAFKQINNGSGDFINTAKADGFLQLPAHESQFLAGTYYPFIPII